MESVSKDNSFCQFLTTMCIVASLIDKEKPTAMITVKAKNGIVELAGTKLPPVHKEDFIKYANEIPFASRIMSSDESMFIHICFSIECTDLEILWMYIDMVESACNQKSLSSLNLYPEYSEDESIIQGLIDKLLGIMNNIKKQRMIYDAMDDCEGKMPRKVYEILYDAVKEEDYKNFCDFQNAFFKWVTIAHKIRAAEK